MDTAHPFLEKSLGTKTFTLLPLEEEASHRRYFRVSTGESTHILMVQEAFEIKNFPFLSIHRLFQEGGVDVPKILDMDAKNGFLLLEDLGDLSLEKKFWESQDPKIILPLYQKALDQLLQIHYATLDKATTSTASQSALDFKKFLWELNYGREHFLEKLCGIQLSKTENKTLDKIFTQICKTLDGQARIVCHRDYHSRNLMIKKGKIRVIDFQDARMGPLQYDLVSLLGDSYVELTEPTQEALVKYYLRGRENLNIHGQELENFQEIYELQNIQRGFKVCGSFASFYNLRRDGRYLKYLKPALRRLQKSLLTLKDFEDFKNFEDILQNHDVYTRQFKTKPLKNRPVEKI